MTKYKHIAVDDKTFKLFLEARKEYLEEYPREALLHPSNSHILHHILEVWLKL